MIWAHESSELFPIVIRWGFLAPSMPARDEGITRLLVMILVCAFITPTVLLFPSVSAEGETTIYVDAINCPNTGDGSSSNPYCSIHDAVLASSSGDTIDLANGTYPVTSPIEIHHPLTMIGAQDGNSALQRTSGDASESVIDLRGANNKILIFKLKIIN